ncbi:MAG: EAL domain-containing protein [Deltaproteobacteria bacterium]|nr:EAL domain-containing protein [Deltaproteobacteria bacterium]MBW2418754.1 EAL domain-containing protein [Deltaproteobacteria bacterium]
MSSDGLNLPGADRAIRLLLVGATDEQAGWLRGLLQKSKTLRFETLRVAAIDPAQGEQSAAPRVDAVLLFCPTADPTELEALVSAGIAFPECASLVIADLEDEHFAMEALAGGARVALVRGGLTASALVSALLAAIASHRTIRALGVARKRERHLGNHDQLTGLANRYLFNDRLQQAVAAAGRNGRKMAVLFIDLDNFKLVNDTLGHGVGDGLLRSVAGHLSSSLRESDTAARVGGDEFALLLTNLHDELDAERIARKILSALDHPIELRDRSISCTVSIGIATLPGDGSDPKELVRKADTAMYHAKKRGRNRCEFYTDDMNEAVLRRVQLEGGLRTAIQDGSLRLHYQPLFDLRRERIVGAEALIRWQHPELGFLAPADFLPLAEETGQIVTVGEWVLQTACRQNVRWQRGGNEGFRMSVNVSARQLLEADFVDQVREALMTSGLSPELLDIEITESSLVSDAEVTVNALRALSELGVHISIDDFGTGYSALSYLKHLPIDALKIDQSFVRSLKSDPADATIIQAVVMMARGLNLTTVAEGVETHDQLLLLGSYGCNRMQGYLFGRPVEAEAFEERLRDPTFHWHRGDEESPGD